MAWAAVALVVNWVQQVAYRATFEGLDGPADLLPGRFAAYAGRIAWDSGLYLRVAEVGYPSGEQLEAGFPAYALAVRALHGVLGGYQEAAVAVSMASGLAAAVLLWAWTGRRGLDLPARRTALAVMLLYPWAFVLYGVAYGDPMLLVLVLATALLADDRRWVLAGLVGGLATATRPTGLVVVPFLVVAALESSGALVVPRTPPRSARPADRAAAAWRTLRGVRLRPGRLRAAHLGVLLSAWGVVAFAVHLWIDRGDPFAFWTAQTSGYGHGALTDPRTWLKASFLVEPGLEVRHVGDVLNEVAATAVLGVAVVAAPAVGRRFGRGYTVMVLALAVQVWAFSRWVAPGGRYLLPVVPFVAAWAAPRLAAAHRATGVLLAVSAAAMVVLAAGFAGVFALHW